MTTREATCDGKDDSIQDVNGNPKLSSNKRRAFALTLGLFSLVLSLLIGEIAIRGLGERPLEIKRPEIVVEPGGKYFRQDSVLGYTHLPGKYNVTLRGEYEFTTIHREDTLRITHPQENDSLYVDKDKIWIFGGSFTHGWAINDHETYPWIVQEQISDHYEVLNWGVSGYGTIHSLLQLQSGLETLVKPKYAILTYSWRHDDRNTFSTARRKKVASWNFLGPLTQPYARVDERGELVMMRADTVEYDEWPLVRISALTNFLQDKLNEYKDRSIKTYTVTKQIILRMNEICEQNGIKFIVATISKHAADPGKMARFCAENDILFTDMTVDLDSEGMRNLPWDGHPSFKANKQHADKIFQYLQTAIPLPKLEPADTVH